MKLITFKSLEFIISKVCALKKKLKTKIKGYIIKPCEMQVTSLGIEKGILLKLSILPKQLPWLFVGKFHLIIN